MATKLNGNGENPIAVRGWTQAERDFSFYAIEIEVVTDPGVENLVTENDVVWDEHSSASGYFNAQVISDAQGAEFASLDEDIATVSSGGFVSRVADGTARITATTPRLKKQIEVAVSSYEGTTTRHFDSFVPGTLGAHLVEQVDDRIAGLDPNVARPLFSICQPYNNVCVYNPDNWAIAGGVDVTCLSVYNSQTSFKRGGTLVAPDLLITTNHSPHEVGLTVYFVNPDNELLSRTIAARGQVGTLGDLHLHRLDAPLSESDGIGTAALVSRAQLLAYCPSIPATGLAGQDASGFSIPMWSTRQTKHLLVREAFYLEETLIPTPAALNNRYPIDETRAAFDDAIYIYGDSGHGRGLVVNERLVITGHDDGGRLPGDQLATMQALAATLGSSYGDEIELVDLSGFSSFA